MTGVLHHPVPPLGHAVLRHDAVLEVHLDQVLLDEHIHHLAHEARRHAVTVGVDVDAEVGRHLALLPTRLQIARVVADRAQDPALRGLEAVDGTLKGGAVDPHVRHVPQPLGQMEIQRGVALELQPTQGVAFHVADPALHLPLRPGAVGLAGPRAHAPVLAERQELRVERDLPRARVGQHQGLRVVHQQLLRDAAKVLECVFDPEDPVPLAQAEADLRVFPAAVAQRRDEHEPLLGDFPDLQPLLPEVDLHLLARRCLEPQRCPVVHDLLPPQRTQRPLHRPQAHPHAHCQQLLTEHVPVPDTRPPAFANPVPMGIQQRHPVRPAVAAIRPCLQPGSHRVPGDPKLAHDPPHTPTQLPQSEDLPSLLVAQHPVLRMPENEADPLPSHCFPPP